MHAVCVAGLIGTIPRSGGQEARLLQLEKLLPVTRALLFL